MKIPKMLFFLQLSFRQRKIPQNFIFKNCPSDKGKSLKIFLFFLTVLQTKEKTTKFYFLITVLRTQENPTYFFKHCPSAKGKSLKILYFLKTVLQTKENP